MEKLWDQYFGVLWCIPSQRRYKTTQKKIKKEMLERNERNSNECGFRKLLFISNAG